MEDLSQCPLQNGRLSDAGQTQDSYSDEMDKKRGKSKTKKAHDDNEPTQGKTKSTAVKKNSGGDSEDGAFSEPPNGRAGFCKFLQHFDMEATRHDPKTHSMSFNLPHLPLTRDWHGQAYIADLVYQVAPGIFYHMFCNAARRPTRNDFWSLDVHKMAGGRPCSVITNKTVIEIAPQMYQADSSLTCLPVDMHVRRGGQKYFYWAEDFWTSDRSHRVMRCLSTTLFFNTSTRTAIELPSDLVSSLPGLESELVPDIWHVDTPAPPTNAFRYTVRVVWGHVDFNGHMGFQRYAQHAQDAILLAVTSQETEAITTLTMSNMEAGVNSLSVEYIKECCHGDMLDLFVWQDGTLRNTAHCWMKKGEEVCSKITFIFYDALSRASL